MSSTDCVFCRIVAGQIPARTILATDAAVAFLDVAPLAEGHTLLIPRRHVVRVEDLPDSDAAELARLLPRLARAIRAACGSPGLNILQNNGPEAGQVVGHLHIHLIPRRASDGLGYRWNAGAYAPGRAEAMHQAVCDALKAGG